MLRYHLGELVSRTWYHAVGYHGLISCDTDIAGTGSHIHQSQIQHTEALGYGHLHGRYGLQCEVGYMKPRHLHCLVQPVHHLIRQEGGYHVGSYIAALVSQQIRHLILVQIVPLHGISHTIELDIERALLYEPLIGSLCAEELQ